MRALPLLLLAWCGSSDPPASDPRGSAAATGSAPAPSATAAPAEDVVAAICKKATCTGPMAMVTPWADASGAVKRYELQPDIQRCSHGPHQIFDGAGELKLQIAERPIVPGSPEAQKIHADRDAQLGGLTAGKATSCR